MINKIPVHFKAWIYYSLLSSWVPKWLDQKVLSFRNLRTLLVLKQIILLWGEFSSCLLLPFSCLVSSCTSFCISGICMRSQGPLGLKLSIQKNEDHGIFMADRCGNSGNGDRFYFPGLQYHCRWWLKPWSLKKNKNKKHLLLGRKATTILDSILKSRDITLWTKICIVKAVVFPVVLYVIAVP